MNTQISRAPLSHDLIEFRDFISTLIPLLQGQEDWYTSLYFERKSTRTFTANLKQSDRNDQVSQGLVLRIHDGYTLYEQATDDLAEDSLKKLAVSFCQRVKASQPIDKKIPRRVYVPKKWAERIHTKLDAEITSQIPPNPSVSTPVHFGIRYVEDPRAQLPEACMESLKKILSRCRALAPQYELSSADLSYVAARQTFAQEESIFIDRETFMSQTIFRLSLFLVTMSGPDRTFVRIGGLGGLETVQMRDEDIARLLRDLKALKSAERLQPGKYRVLFGPVLTGVLAHEAFGHAQEGDTCARGRSKAWELHKTGQIVGNEHATILNNPAIYKMGTESFAAWGSTFFDEEGWLAQEQVLLDRGVLQAPMTNLTSAIRLDVPRTANGKRESWANGVYTRQTNTYFSPGNHTLNDLYKETGNGFLALHPAGGMEDPKGMGIQVGISFLEEIKEGKPTGRLFKGPAGGDIQLTGYTPDVLNSIVAKSKIEAGSTTQDQAKHPYNDVGGCGKYHKEFVYAGCGGPYMLLDQIILG